MPRRWTIHRVRTGRCRFERAGEDAELAAALREGEESRGDKARKGMIEGLSKIEDPEG